MGNLAWYQLSVRDSATAERYSPGLRSLLRHFEVSCLEIRDPEVHRPDDRSVAEKYCDGAQVDTEIAIRLIESMLRQEGFWCRLESPDAEVHVGEEVLHLGLRASNRSWLESLPLVQVQHSPYMIVRDPEHAYIPAGDVFWEWLVESIPEHGDRILLCQWAGGLGGERWHRIRSQNDVVEVVDGLVPRSIVAIFDSGHFGDAGDLDRILGEVEGMVPITGNLRVLRPLNTGSRLVSDVVAEPEELKYLATGSRTNEILFRWPGADNVLSGVTLAVCPDPDGRVRGSARFDCS